MRMRGVSRLCCAGSLYGAASADDPHEYDDDGDHQQCMDETAKSVGGDQSQQPQYDQDEGDGVKHDLPFK